MLAVLIATLVTALCLLSLRIPFVWMSLMAIDDPSDAHELGMALVASRVYPAPHPSSLPSPGAVFPTGNPFREQGPPACMAKLIMLRHKLNNQTNSRKRRVSPPARQNPRTFVLPQARQRPNTAWIRMPKSTYGRLQ
ncbi:hypothetical protein EWM64_g2221 [Hericium alpestre]|uniref:Uncharacterized protein n=1 Tax=Hericium alpestre TaxID=135208 RepID=A0A4Z0A827_9AGAM|nr:hypothetical protein EWM64_g2221 [Hericium alpestre]